MNQTTNNTIYGLDVKTTIDNTTFLILNIAFEHFFKPLPRHSHGNNSYELHYIPNGLGQAVIDGSSYELTPGTLYMTGPHVEHEQIPSPMDPMTEYSIYFQLQEEDALLVFSGSTADKFLKKRFWIGPDTQNLGVLMEQLFYELKYKYTGYMIQVEALLQQCLVKVVRNYEGNRFSKQHFAPSNLIDGKTLIIERAFLSLRDHYSGKPGKDSWVKCPPDGTVPEKILRQDLSAEKTRSPNVCGKNLSDRQTPEHHADCGETELLHIPTFHPGVSTALRHHCQ